MKIVHSYQMKAALMWYYRFKRNMICAPELACGGGIADCVVYNGHGIHEIEIKTSKSDLYNGEKKKDKHHYYKEGYHRWATVPNFFSICVPSHLEEIAKQWVKENNPKYGVIRCADTEFISDSVSIARTAKALHERPLHSFHYSMLRKMSAIVILNYQEKYWKQ